MFYIPFDREFHGEQEYMFLDVFRSFLPFDKLKILDECDKFNFPLFFSKFQFSNLSVNSDYSH